MLNVPLHQTVVRVERLPPSPVAQLCGAVSRRDDIRKQDRREDAIDIRRASDSGEEPLDLVEDRVLIPGVERVVVARKLCVDGAFDVFPQIAAVTDEVVTVPGSV